MNNRDLIKLLTGTAFLFAASAACAHPGHEMTAQGLIGGLAHPFSGVDHLLAMVTVGVWSAMQARSLRTSLRMPLAFLAMMLVGGAIGLAGWSLPAVEPMIAASLLALGMLVAMRVQLPAWVGMVVVGGFALFHGYAHGTELPVVAISSILPYVAGFSMATLILQGVGLGLGVLARRYAGWAIQVAGAGVALYGMGLLAA